MIRLALNLIASLACYIFEGWSDGIVIDSHKGGWTGSGEWHSTKQIAYAVLHMAIFDAQVPGAGILSSGLITIASVLLGRIIVHPIFARIRTGQPVNVYSTCDSCDDATRFRLGWKFWLFGWDWWDGLVLIVRDELGVPQFVFCSFLVAVPCAIQVILSTN